MEKKSAKNCTLYHVVNKAVWADIGAMNIVAPNIGAAMFVAPRSTKKHRHCTTKKISRIF
jgi:hypothetical protein